MLREYLYTLDVVKRHIAKEVLALKSIHNEVVSVLRIVWATEG